MNFKSLIHIITIEPTSNLKSYTFRQVWKIWGRSQTFHIKPHAKVTSYRISKDVLTLTKVQINILIFCIQCSSNPTSYRMFLSSDKKETDRQSPQIFLPNISLIVYPTQKL